MIALWKMVVKRALHYVVGRVVDLIDENCQEDTVSQMQLIVLETQTSTTWLIFTTALHSSYHFEILHIHSQTYIFYDVTQLQRRTAKQSS